MHEIDISILNEHQLIELNRKIVERIRFLRQSRAHREMMQFNIGNTVCFKTDGNRKIQGTLTKFNQKTVTAITPEGEHWNVSPTLLDKIEIKDVEAEEHFKPKNNPNNKNKNIIVLPTGKDRQIGLRLDKFQNVPKNAPCPCGSGKKYKRCCLLPQLSEKIRSNFKKCLIFG